MSRCGPATLRVATYNIHACVGTDGRQCPERTLGVLAELDADIIALQEVDSRGRGPDDIDQFELMAAKTGLHAIPGPNVHAHYGAYGNVLLSRWPPVRVARVDLSVPGYERRGAIDAAFEVDGATVRVVATHLGLRWRERQRQMRQLDNLIGGGEGRSTVVAVAGDFNIWGISLPRRRRGWRWRRGAIVRSFPSRWPLLALDRIAVSPAERLAQITAHRSPRARAASDHLPVVATLEI